MLKGIEQEKQAGLHSAAEIPPVLLRIADTRSISRYHHRWCTGDSASTDCNCSKWYRPRSGTTRRSSSRFYWPRSSRRCSSHRCSPWSKTVDRVEWPSSMRRCEASKADRRKTVGTELSWRYLRSSSFWWHSDPSSIGQLHRYHSPLNDRINWLQ